MTHERCPEEDAEAILSNLKMEGRCSAHSVYASLENHVMYAPFNRISRHAARRGEVMEELGPGLQTSPQMPVLRLHGGSLVVSRASGA